MNTHHEWNQHYYEYMSLHMNLAFILEWDKMFNATETLWNIFIYTERLVHLWMTLNVNPILQSRSPAKHIVTWQVTWLFNAQSQTLEKSLAYVLWADN